MTTLYLYSTEACHLCEQAQALIEPMLDASLSLRVVDISESDELMDRYGIRIPVLRRADSGDELGWPFDRSQLRAFLAAH